ncbi:MAG: sigma-54-dependent Fis family transcriptional regulator [Planctomycetes bacterium]|nr:sigma-54-dependent Fis family transcriptional regulator [Planctomycetota bacterium]
MVDRLEEGAPAQPGGPPGADGAGPPGEPAGGQGAAAPPADQAATPLPAAQVDPAAPQPQPEPTPAAPLSQAPSSQAQASIEAAETMARLWAEPRESRALSGFEELVSHSPLMWDIFETCQRVAPTDATVLLLGETGTGKELLARAIHRTSGRKGRFVAVNCGAVTETLIESELFGHEKGSFTGATGRQVGLFRHADGGTLFLDEIGSLPLSAQFSLLRALQEGAVRPIGGNEEISVNVRIIAATSTPLDVAVQQGTFREDLLYRLDVIRIIIPPLRERPEDIPYLFKWFCERQARHHDTKPPELTDGFVEAMLTYRWPGNVRQLENFTERLVLTFSGPRLTKEQFLQLMRPYRGDEGQQADGAAHGLGLTGAPAISGAGLSDPFNPTTYLRRAPAADVSKTLAEFLDPVTLDLERRYLQAALRLNEGRIQATANTAGLSRRTLLRKLKKHGLDKRDYTGG